MDNESIGARAKNQENANQLWEFIKQAIILGEPFLFHLEDGVTVEYDKHQATFKLAPSHSKQEGKE